MTARRSGRMSHTAREGLPQRRRPASPRPREARPSDRSRYLSFSRQTAWRGRQSPACCRLLWLRSPPPTGASRSETTWPIHCGHTRGRAAPSSRASAPLPARLLSGTSLQREMAGAAPLRWVHARLQRQACHR